MCGIVGAIDLKGKREFPQAKLLAMSNSISHRGPDDEFTHLEPGIAFAVRRLAIVDIAHGRQPISNSDESLWAAFNGEIFDHEEIRANLIKQGHNVKTKCDTELWLHLYNKHQEKLFDFIKGQFAVSLWDKKKQLLILGRDRVGICPLYYTISDGWLLWASEVKSLFASGLVVPEPDTKGIDYLFNFFCAGTTRTYFKGIKLIPPGHFIRVQDGNFKIIQYWDLNFPKQGEEKKSQNPELLVDELEDLLKKSVKKRLDCDVPVVSYISGGVDSSLVLNLSCKENIKNPTKAFTISLDEGVGHNEYTESEEAAKACGAELNCLNLNTEKLAEAFPELIAATEGPVLDTSCSAMMQLAAEVNKQGYKVVLTGEGADEAFAGYLCFKAQKISEICRQWLGPTIPNFARKLTAAASHSKSARQLVTPEGAMGGAHPAQGFLYEIMGMARASVYSEDMWDSLGDHDPYEDLQITNKDISTWHPLNQSLYVGYKVMLPGLLMMSKGDRIAMHSSVEMRYPYLDEDIIKFCAEIDPRYKLKSFKEKWLLRQVAARNLPQNIANRRKINFSTSLSKVFLGKDRPFWVDQLLSEESIKKAGYFDYEKVNYERILLANFPRIMPRQYILDATLTTVVSTQLWHHIFFGGLCDMPTVFSSSADI